MSRIKEKVYKCYIRVKYTISLNQGINMSYKEAKKILDNFCHHDTVPAFCQKVNYNPEYDLMIIVPVYNSEKYLNECIQSLVKQNTHYSYKIVLVDDGSTDQSGNILENYSQEKKVEIIHEKNRGVAGARNFALKNICAKYILFVDSDDLLADNAIELLMETAIKNKADIVEGNYIEFSAVKSVQGKEKKETISGYPWGKVIRAEKMFNLCFPEGYQYEDTIIENLLLPSCDVKCAIPNILYYYRENSSGITATLNGKKESVDTLYMTYFCLKESLARGNRIHLKKYLNQVRLNWLRTQNLPVDVQKAIFVIEINMFNKYFSQIGNHEEEKFRKLETVIRKKSFDSYEKLMNTWNIWK